MPQKLSPKQKKLIQLMPKVEAGEITQEYALAVVGYERQVAWYRDMRTIQKLTK